MGDFKWDVFKPWMLRIRKVCMFPWQQRKIIYNEIKHFPRNNDKWVIYVNTEDKKLDNIFLKSYNIFSIHNIL